MADFTVPLVICLQLCVCIGVSIAVSETPTSTTTAKPDSQQSPMFSIHDNVMLMLIMSEEHRVDVNYTIPCPGDSHSYILVQVTSGDNEIFSVEGNSSFLIPCTGSLPETNGFDIGGNSVEHTTTDADGLATGIVEGSFAVRVHAKLVGVAYLNIATRTVQPIPEGPQSFLHRDLQNDVNDSPSRTNRSSESTEAFRVAVLRKDRPIDKVFVLSVAVVLCVIGVGFGCELDLDVVKECVKKPLAPLIGIGCQYIIMPLIGTCVALVTASRDPSAALGIFLCGICPGGGVSNIFSVLLDGDVSLSITMTFLSNILSIGVLPLYVSTLGRVFLQGSEWDLQIPYVGMLQIMAFNVIPLLIGVAIKYKAPRVSLFITRIQKPVLLIVLIFMLVIGIYTNLILFRLFRIRHILAGCSLPYFGYVIGGAIAAICKQPVARVLTIALETGMQNVGIAILLIKVSFPQPVSDLTAVAPMASGTMTPLPVLLVTLVYVTYQKCCKKYTPVKTDVDLEIKVKTADREENSFIEEKISSI